MSGIFVLYGIVAKVYCYCFLTTVLEELKKNCNCTLRLVNLLSVRRPFLK